MAEPQLLSIGVDNFLARIRPHGRPFTAFPPSLDVNDTRREPAESLHAWFVRLVDKYCGGDPTLVALEENVAVFAKFHWLKDRLRFASVPMLIAECDLEQLYLDDKADAVYIRLDLNYETLGEPFSHPLAHIPVRDERHPRFSLDGGTSGNVIVDFLEFVYRNYLPADWLAWARRQWLAKNLVGPAEEEDEDPFGWLVRAFHGHQIDVLRSNAPLIANMKRALRELKDSRFGEHMDGTDREVLEYPLAR